MKGKVCLISFCVALVGLMAAGKIAHEKRPSVLMDHSNADHRVVSFFRKEYQPLLMGIEEIALEESKIIVEVESTGKNEYVHGDLIQEVSFVKTIKGKVDEKKLHKKIYYVGNGWWEGGRCVSTGFTNYLKKGERYVLFADAIVEDYDKQASVILAVIDLPGMRCLNISSDQSSVCTSKEEQTEYGNVRGSEFFCNDEETLEKMKQCKYSILKKLDVSPLW